MVRIHTENSDQINFYPFVPLEISVLNEFTLGHLCYFLTDVPPQPNSPPDTVLGESHRGARLPEPPYLSQELTPFRGLPLLTK